MDVPGLEIQFTDQAVFLPQLGLWLDAHNPQTSGLVFVSHAHSDHVAAHREVILSAPTARLMQDRLPGLRHEHIVGFGQSRQFPGRALDFEVTLLPAGHIFGSAMCLLCTGVESLLYTGDFKLRPGLSAEVCEPQSADLLVMETTFGRPQYVFPPADQVLKAVLRFCREALDNDETPVLLGYSLGKSQELLCSLGDAGLPLMLHGAVFRLTKIYEQFGQCFPNYERYQPDAARGKVLLCPPNVVNSAMLRNLGKIRTAILTGWAVDPNCRYRYQCDAAFPLSDHADFPELIELVKRVQPKRVYTLHGFAAEFAQTLRELGYDARSLSQEEQFALPLGPLAPGLVASPKPQASSQVEPTGSATPQLAASTADRFICFAEICQRVSADPRKLEKVRLLAEYLRELESSALASAATWFSGRPIPATQNKALQLGWAVLREALCAVVNVPEQAFHQAYLKHSDLGEAAGELLGARRMSPTLLLNEVSQLFAKLHAARGPLAKRPLLKAALERCTALEAKYLVKIITGDLRIGLKEGLVEEAVAAAFNCPVEKVRNTHLLVGDLGQTAEMARAGNLESASIIPFRPIRFMLASPEESAAAIWERLQERAGGRGSRAGERGPTIEPADPQLQNQPASAWIEDKYDGIRCQLHKVESRVVLYSRDLKENTASFGDLAEGLRLHSGDWILDGEIVAMQGDEVLPFSELQKRLGRREPDLFMREEVPIKFVAFDLMWLNGTSLLDLPLRDRRRLLEQLQPLPPCIRLAQTMCATSISQIEEAFSAARARGNEGLMIKDPNSAYTPGRRGLAWLKLKKAFATLDCVVIGAEYGHGKRSKVLSDYTFAVRDEATGQLKTIGKAYTGLTDAEIAVLTEHFHSTAVRQHGRYFEVPPDTVLEIAFDRIQRSDRHTSGLAMRFPRIARIRTDKAVADIDTVQTAEQLLKRLEQKKPAADA